LPCGAPVYFSLIMWSLSFFKKPVLKIYSRAQIIILPKVNENILI
jgi:hypothetical protein